MCEHPSPLPILTLLSYLPLSTYCFFSFLKAVIWSITVFFFFYLWHPLHIILQKMAMHNFCSLKSYNVVKFVREKKIWHDVREVRSFCLVGKQGTGTVNTSYLNPQWKKFTSAAGSAVQALQSWILFECIRFCLNVSDSFCLSQLCAYSLFSKLHFADEIILRPDTVVQIRPKSLFFKIWDFGWFSVLNTCFIR